MIATPEYNFSPAYFPAGTAQYHINADIAFAVKGYVPSNYLRAGSRLRWVALT